MKTLRDARAHVRSLDSALLAAIYSLLRFFGMGESRATREFDFHHATAVNPVSGSRRESWRKRRTLPRRRRRRRRGKRGRRRCRVSHLDARLEIIPLGHFLVLRRGNFSPSAQLLLGVVQVKDRHRVQPALEYQARQVLNVVLPAGKSTQILVGSRDFSRARPSRLPRPGRFCNAPGCDRTSWRAISARRVACTFRDRPCLARAAVPAASYGSFELDTRRNESWDTREGPR